ncbi:MAG: DUF504 domain-containing protein [Burkholderiales bacterium]|nr:DUF504 domain-containing protein [Burkholderiales bacterium]
MKKMPIHELPARIRWEPAFGRARFVIGYWHPVAGAEADAALARIGFAPGAHFAIEAVEADGSVHTVPHHRVRRLWRVGELIWHRTAPPRCGARGAQS